MVISEWPNRPPQSVELLGPIVVEHSKKKKWKHRFALTQEEARKLQQEKDQVVQRQRADEDLDAIFSLDEQDRKRPADEIPPPPPYVPPPEEPSVPKAEVRQGRGFAMNVIEELGDDKVPMAENRPRKFRMGLLSGDSDRETKRPRKENPPPPPPPQRGDKPPPPPPRGVPPAFESSPSADGIEAPPPPPLPSVNL